MIDSEFASYPDFKTGAVFGPVLFPNPVRRFFRGVRLRFPSGGTRTTERAAWGRPARIWEDYMETLFVTESRELLFTGTEDIDVRPLHSPVLH